ncbi:hypothetical protein AB8O55_22365 [Saccharopolyspora cebuensis]|uniref:Uncharacterized protein n=1 Tax=Saccharopolyspora cebuensis TaxID=418759 RepID=A0ABV4CM46_9PSEU
MAFHLVRGDAAGDLGENTVLDTSVHPPRVQHLHFAIDAWTGDDLIERFPVLLVTQRLAEALSASGMGAFQLRDAAISVEPEAEELLHGTGFEAVPGFRWFHVTGTAGRDDFGVDSQASLVVSDNALALLRQFNLDGSDIEDYHG